MQRLTPSEIRACEHPRLSSRYVVAILCAISLAPFLIVLSIVGIFTLILIWIIIFLWIASEIIYAGLMDNLVLVSDLNYPRIHSLGEEVHSALSIRKKISIFVYEQGDFNSFLVKIFRRRAIFLNSEVLENGVSDDEVRWIVGRFAGYLRVQQDAGFVGWLVRVAEHSGLYTLLIFPYNRAMVYTGDRLGLAAIDGDIGSAISAMQKLLVGRQLGYSVNPLGIIEQRRQTKGSLFAFLARIGSPFPSSTARYVDLISFAQQRFPEAYLRFEATTPGLPSDLRSLSGEKTAPGSIAKAIGYYLAFGLALILTVVFWSMLGRWMEPTPADYSVENTLTENMAFDPASPPDVMTNVDAYEDANSVVSNTDTASQRNCNSDRHVSMENRTGRTIYQLMAINESTGTVSDNKLHNGTLSPDATENIDWDDGSCTCMFRFKYEIDGVYYAYPSALDVCKVGTFTIEPPVGDTNASGNAM